MNISWTKNVCSHNAIAMTIYIEYHTWLQKFNAALSIQRIAHVITTLLTFLLQDAMFLNRIFPDLSKAFTKLTSFSNLATNVAGYFPQNQVSHAHGPSAFSASHSTVDRMQYLV